MGWKNLKKFDIIGITKRRMRQCMKDNPELRLQNNPQRIAKKRRVLPWNSPGTYSVSVDLAAGPIQVGSTVVLTNTGKVKVTLDAHTKPFGIALSTSDSKGTVTIQVY